MRERLFHLQPVFPLRNRARGGLLEIAPWIDVVLLFVLVMITLSGTIRKPGLVVDLPVARSGAGARYDAFVLTAPGEEVFFFNDQKVKPAVLPDRLRETARRHPGAELIIEADRRLTHGAITELYDLAVAAGWSRVVMATRLESTASPAAP